MTIQTRLAFLQSTWHWYHSCHTRFLSQNRMLIVCVPRNQVYIHTVQKMDTKLPMSQYITFYQIMSLQKTKSNTLGSIAAERHHNSTGNRPR
jgi:hypothetical protein